MVKLLQPGWHERRERAGDISLNLVEAGPKTGPAVFLLHGFPEFWWAWRHQIGPLAAAGFRVIAPDLRGYNKSDAPLDVSMYRRDRLAADIIALADALGIDRFDLVGHDWGGGVAWHVVAAHGERIRRLLIMDMPHPEVMPGFAMRHPTQLLRSSYMAAFQTPLLPEAVLSAGDFFLLRRALADSARDAGVFPSDVLDCYAEAWREPRTITPMLNYYRALMVPGAGPVGRITLPTLILWGGRDQALDNRLARESAAMCDNATVEVFENATHWLHHEEPDAVAEVMLGFFTADKPR
jgi:pimeloyl-ACP methyl ester carboxylesterase